MLSKTQGAAPQQRLTLLQKLDLLPGVLSIIAATILSMFTGLFRGENGTPTYHLHVAYALMRKATCRLSTLQLQYIAPTTDKLYEQFARSKKFKPQSVDLGFGAQGHWMGNKDAKNVIIWYHGGGFALAANPGYLAFWTEMLKTFGAAGKDVAIFALTYTLTPHAIYPTQLIQAVEALRYILDETARSPSQVYLAGDSAGGNMVFGVLSHIAHPHSNIKRLSIDQPIAGALTISPWVSLDESHGKETVDVTRDLVTPYNGETWSRSYLGGQPRDNYTDAFDAPATWFRNFPVQKILIMGGEFEILMPLIEDFATRLQSAFPATEFFVGRREGHVAPIYNKYCYHFAETEMDKKTKDWFVENLS